MSFLKNVFEKKEKSITDYEDFWHWFLKYEKVFHKVVAQKGDIENDFLNKIAPKLNELNDCFFYLTGMWDEDTVEIIITADGAIKNIVFVEELINSSPKIKGWKFTALIPALDIKDVKIEMQRYIFTHENLSFYSNDHPDYPDEIDISVIHDDCNEGNLATITNGVHIFLDNYLGEVNFATLVDDISVISKNCALKELIPIGKLKDFLSWRQKEFIEKNNGVRYKSENDKHSILEAELPNGKFLIAVINTDLLNWDAKASHPWILQIEITYDGSFNNGMPDDASYKLLDKIEGQILESLKDFEGYLYVGRQTADGIREIYFACKDFRNPSKVMHKIKNTLNKPEISFDIYKDKYWRSFNRFNPAL
jgi:hypothetical protein